MTKTLQKKSMNVFILAAGLGTRLKPITDTKPKALVPVDERPLLQILIQKLKKECDELSVVVNVHHFGQQIIDFIYGNNRFGIQIQVSDERDGLLDTGGGIKKAAAMFHDDSPLLIHNVDILSDLNLSAFYSRHIADTRSDATLVVSERETSRYLLFDNQNRLVGWTNVTTGEVKTPFKNLDMTTCNKYAFSGIHVMSKPLLDAMRTWQDKFSIIDFYLDMCDKAVIKGEVHNDMRFLDVGKLNSLTSAERMVHELDL